MNQEEIEQMSSQPVRRFLRPGERLSSNDMINRPKPLPRPLTPQQLEAMFGEQQQSRSSLISPPPPSFRSVQYPPQYLPQYREEDEQEEQEEQDEEDEEERTGTDQDTDQDEDQDDDDNDGGELPEKIPLLPPKKTKMMIEMEDEEGRFVDFSLYDDQEKDLLPTSFLIPEKEQWTILLNALKSNFYRVANIERVSNKLVALVADAASLSKGMPLNAVQMVAYARQRQV